MTIIGGQNNSAQHLGWRSPVILYQQTTSRGFYFQEIYNLFKLKSFRRLRHFLSRQKHTHSFPPLREGGDRMCV